ncbi:hypothetical protein AO057_01595 [Curvibacter sp. PAE-UM]|nr:hypothetical protein AO057_01595 [Curvibacter sp. PAE-UM]
MLTQAFQEAYKGRASYHAIQCQTYFVFGCACKTGQLFTLTDGAFEHQVHTLTRPFNQAAFGKCLGQSAIARVLLIQDVGWGDTRRQAPGAHHFQSLRVLANEYRATQPVITMCHCVEQRFAHCDFVKRQQIQTEKTILVALLFVAQVDLVPQCVLPVKEALPVFLAVGCRA